MSYSLYVVPRSIPIILEQVFFFSSTAETMDAMLNRATLLSLEGMIGGDEANVSLVTHIFA